MKPSHRLRRVLGIAYRAALWTRSTREYMTAINADPCPGCGLTRGRHRADCQPSEDPDACAF